MKELYELKLHETCQESGVHVLRVPGGWIYTTNTYRSTFVPFSNEFKPKEPVQKRIEISKEDRMSNFYNAVAVHGKSQNMSKDEMRKFYDYWSESGENEKKMRFEKEKTFDIKKRIVRWMQNVNNNNNASQSEQPRNLMR